MRFDELKINEAPFDTFKDRGTASGGSVPHGGDVAKSGGANWRRAAAGKMPDQIRQDKIAKANAAAARAASSGIPSTGTQTVTNPDEIPTDAGGKGRAKRALEYFVRKGLTPAQAAGIVGNLQAESGQSLKIDAVGDGGKAIGIAQWHPDRRRHFERWKGKPFGKSTFQDQLDFIWWELNNTERNAMAKLRRAKSAEEAAAIVDQYYERSSGQHRQKRIQLAAALLTPSATA